MVRFRGGVSRSTPAIPAKSRLFVTDFTAYLRASNRGQCFRNLLPGRHAARHTKILLDCISAHPRTNSHGVVTADYGVEGDGFYGLKLSQFPPYSVTRTWHVQLGIFWIATAWLASGLFIGLLVSKFEPNIKRSAFMFSSAPCSSSSLAP
jgi:hypothetical protein